MYVTLLTSHEPMSWLNAAAEENISLYANTHHSHQQHKVYREAGEQASGTYRREGRVHYMAAVHGYGGGWYGSRAWCEIVCVHGHGCVYVRVCVSMRVGSHRLLRPRCHGAHAAH